MIDHDYALDLAADKIDFGLDDREEKLLADHLAECREDCKRYADMMAQDEGLLETFTWEDAYTGGEDDEFSPQSDFGDDDEDDEDRPRRPRASADDADDDDARDDASDASDDASDDADDHPSTHEEEGDRWWADEDIEGTDGDKSLPDSVTKVPDLDAPAWDPDADEPDERRRDALDEALDRAPAGDAVAQPDDDDEAEDESEAHESESDGFGAATQNHDLGDYEAQAEADAATDQELAALEEDQDDTFASEASAGVDDAARQNGVTNPEYLHKRAEKAVRDTDGLEHTRFGKVAVYRSSKGIAKRKTHQLPPMASASAAAQIRNAILRSRTGNTGVERYQKRGRLDGKSLHKIAMRDDRLFKRNTFPDPGKFVVWVMVDVSGSMTGRPVAEAATVARALADASGGAPNVRLEVWAWSTPFNRDTRTQNCQAGVLRVWGRGMPTSEVFRLTELPMGGTPDAPVVEWAWKEISKQAKSGETPVLIMCSDGDGDRNLPTALDRAAKHGVKVKSVAMGDYVHEDDQLARYGRGNYVPWAGSIEATARPLATMIAEMAAGR